MDGNRVYSTKDQEYQLKQRLHNHEEEQEKIVSNEEKPEDTQ